jgi:hypothetical protein
MDKMKSNNLIKTWVVLLLVSVVCFTSAVQAGRQDWERREVNWRISGGGRVKAIRYSKKRQLQLFNEKTIPQPNVVRKKILPKELPSQNETMSILSVPEVVANVIDSPLIAGFVPYIAVAVTDKRSDDFDWVAEAHMSIAGRYLTDNPETDFTIGLLDTGASAHIMSHAAANRTGIYGSDLVTPSMIEILGATNSVFGWVSQPLAIFMDGLAAIDPNGMALDDSNMVGQSNVSILVGDEPPPDKPDLPTAIGSPMTVNFVTVIYNDHPVTLTYDGNEYTSPDIRFYDHFDSRIPDYANSVPLNLIPSGAVNIQYIPDLEAIFELIFRPGQPSIIVGNLAQSLFFIDSVDLSHGTNSATDKDRFMFDTGAQITVIGSGIASRLVLNPAEPDFEVEVQDVTGEITIEPGFYIDSLEIPALGDWLSFTNVPVILLDVASPEGGYLEGIIGTNLFTEFNLVLRGGGLLGQDPPSLGFEPIPPRLLSDIAPISGDGIVNLRDLAAFMQTWLATPDSPNWYPKADLAPQPNPDGIVDFLDLAVFAEYWLGTSAP